MPGKNSVSPARAFFLARVAWYEGSEQLSLIWRIKHFRKIMAGKKLAEEHFDKVSHDRVIKFLTFR